MTEIIDVTPRQLEIYRWIERFIADKHYPPTRAEICDAFGWSSTNSAEQQLRVLEKRGALKLVSGVSRGIVLLSETERPKPPPSAATRRRDRK